MSPAGHHRHNARTHAYSSWRHKLQGVDVLVSVICVRSSTVPQQGFCVDGMMGRVCRATRGGRMVVRCSFVVRFKQVRQSPPAALCAEVQRRSSSLEATVDVRTCTTRASTECWRRCCRLFGCEASIAMGEASVAMGTTCGV